MDTKTLGWATVVLGVLVLVAPWVLSGANLQWSETVLGVLTAIAGIMLVR